MSRPPRKLLLSLAAFGLLGPASSPAVAQIPGCEGVEPYVFILLDTSLGMNWSAPCTQAQFDAGECGFVCPTRDCAMPTAGDHPGSKIYQTRQALYEVLSGVDDVHFGFGSLNQDKLAVRAKHWLYKATSAGPSINGTPFPAVGAREAFGAVWPCGSGTTDAGVGCSYSAPADLPDAWERARVQRLPKGGITFADTVQVYVRSGNSYIHRVTYQPVPGGVLGGPLQTTVTTVRCTNSTCSSFLPVGTQTVDWTPVNDFLSFDNATSTPSRTAPETWFPETAAADTSAIYPQCVSTPNNPVGWDANTDTLADTVNGYNLRWPTDSSDPRGAVFSVGDVIPIDWLDKHKDDVLARLAPNVAVDPLAAPDFRTAAYFQDDRQPGESFLRLKDEAARPLLASGPTSIAKSVHAFRRWFDDCAYCNVPNFATAAAAEDPEWLVCRLTYLVVVSDGGDTCAGVNPNADVANLKNKWGVKTFVFAVGVAPNSDTMLRNLAYYGKGEIYYPQTRQQLVDDLTTFFQSIRP